MPTLSRIAVASLVALAAGISSSVLLGGFSINPAFHLIQVIALGVLGAALIFGAAILVAFRLSDYTNPESEEEFEALVIESERLARHGLAVEPDEEEFLDLDPFNDQDFEELVRDALDDLPDLLREALARNVAVVISNGPPPARLRALPRRWRHARQLPRSDHHLPRHPAPRLWPRPGAPSRAGRRDRAPRARPPHRL